jgi:hypothetical protein
VRQLGANRAEVCNQLLVCLFAVSPARKTDEGWTVAESSGAGSKSISIGSESCSPTSMIDASGCPCPKTVCEASSYKEQP